MAAIDGRDRQPVTRGVQRSTRKLPDHALRRLASSEAQDWDARGANEWYWIRRFGHPLFDDIVEPTGVLSDRRLPAKEITEDERRQLTADDLGVLARSFSPGARRVAAEHPSCPRKVLALLSEDSDAEVRRAVGHNPATPAEVIASMRSRSSHRWGGDELATERVKFLWMELDHVSPDHKLALKIANDPGIRYTTEQRLALAKKEHLPVAVRTAFAANRDSPVEILLRLVEDSDAAVRAAAGANGRLPESARLRLLSDKDRDVRREVMVKGRFSEAVVVSWDNDDERRRLLAARLKAGVWIYGTNRLEDSESVLRELARSPHPGTRAAVALNENTPIDVLEQLADDAQESVRESVDQALGYEVANNRYQGSLSWTHIWWFRRELDESELSQLSQSANPRIRGSIASRPQHDIHPRTLGTLARDPDPSVRGDVAHHPWIGFDDLVRLSDDPDENVRRTAANSIRGQLRFRQDPPREKAKNWLEWQDHIPDQIPREYGSGSGLDMQRLRLGSPWERKANWPEEALDRLARVENEDVRSAVASYAGSYGARKGEQWASRFDLKLSPEALTRLLQDPSDRVRQACLDHSGSAAVKVAADPDTPREALIGYARSSESPVRRSVAKNAATPGPVLSHLARDSDVAVRRAVAGNEATPGEALSVLSEAHVDRVEHPDHDLVLALMSNPSSPPKLLERMAARRSDFWWEHECERRLARNPSSPQAVLSELAFSRWADVREAIAGHPNTPHETLEILGLDESSRVRQVASSRGITGIE